MKQLDFYNEEAKKIEESLKKLDVRAPEVAAILRRHVKPEDQPPHTSGEMGPNPQQPKEEETKREPWGIGSGLPKGDL